MSWLKKKSDPLTERARSLNNDIAALEAQIKRLDAQLHRAESHPRLRSTAVPHGATIAHTTHTATAAPPSPTPPPQREPIFEDMSHAPLKEAAAPINTPEHFNELGVRKYDATALGEKVKQMFRGSTPANPRLVSYLAAGGIQGLQPLRREKRVARNRLLLLAAFLCLMLVGIIYMLARNR